MQTEFIHNTNYIAYVFNQVQDLLEVPAPSAPLTHYSEQVETGGNNRMQENPCKLFALMLKVTPWNFCNNMGPPRSYSMMLHKPEGLSFEADL